MPSGQEIRDGLKSAADRRARGGEIHAKGTEELRRWLEAVQESDEITLVEAAELARISRVAAYKILGRE